MRLAQARVAILMPVYNAEKTILRAINSILNQTYPPDYMHLFLVDNNCTDSSISLTEDTLLAFNKQFPNFEYTVTSCKVPGIVPALNSGLQQILAEGGWYDLIARLDADDLWHPEKIQKQVDFMKANPEVHILGTQIRQVTPDGQELGVLQHPIEDAGIKMKLLAGYNAIAHPSVVMRPEIFLRTGGYDNTYPIAEDYHLWLRCIPFYNFANLPEALVDYTVSHNPKYNPLSPQLACMATLQAFQRLHKETDQ